MQVQVWQAALFGLLACLASMPGLGGTVLGNYTLGRPLVAGLIVGLIMGDVQTGIYLGAAIQVVYIALVTPGGTVSADVRAISYIGIPLSMVAVHSMGLNPASPEGQAMAVTLGSAVGTIGTVLFYGTATVNLVWQHMGWRALEKGDLRKLYVVDMGLPWISHILCSFIPTFIIIKVGTSMVDLMKAYLPTSKTPIRTGKKVAVVGGGNVAMDAARSALRLGAETVYIVYRRGMAELPARKEEVEHAEEEGIIFKTLCNPVEIHANDEGFVKSITCIEMELGEPDASGRRRPIEKKGSEFELDVDTVIMSLGTSPNPLIRSTTPGLETNKHGCIVTDGDDGKTSRDGVYAGGDAVTGAATVIKAMGAGKAAAKAIDEYIQSK